MAGQHVRRIGRGIAAWVSVLAVALSEGCARSEPAIEPTDQPGVYYVSPDGFDSNPGTLSQPWRTIQRAAGQLAPGETVFIRDGTYSEQITPEQSGTAGQPIVYAAYAGETPVIDGNNEVYRLIEIIGKRHLVFDGLRLQNPFDEWAHVENSDHITFRNMVFTNTDLRDRNFQGILFRYSSYNRVVNSLLENWGAYYPNGDQSGNHIRIFGDFEAGGYNLIEGNIFIRGAQGCVMVNAPYNIIRDNVFDNEWQKGVYIGYFEGTIGGEVPGTVFPAVHNLVENNRFVRHGPSRYQHGGRAYEESSVGTIFRRNTLQNADYLGAEIVAFGTYAFQSSRNHWYNNVIANNGSAGFECLSTGIMGTSEPGTQFYGNVFKNNILYDNDLTCDKKPHLVGLRLNPDNANPPGVSPPLFGMIFAGNLFENVRAEACSRRLQQDGNGYGDCYLYIAGINEADAAWFEARYPQNFWGNVEGAPRFVQYDPSANEFDFHLRPDSPAIDAGVDLTFAVSAGSGTVISVDDAWYFHDGYGGMIAPDSIRVGDEMASIAHVDYEANRITVDRPLVWEQGTPVNLPFSGSRPDIGAFEAGPNDAE